MRRRASIPFEKIGFVLFACAFLALAARPAWAHALLVSSTPAANSAVNPGGLEAILKYDSRVVPAGCALSLMAPNGKVTKLPIGHQPAPEVLTTRLKHLVRGRYMLRWQALSSDGHITRGAIPFRVR